MGKYRKKPIVVEAVEWTGNNMAEIREFAEEKVKWFLPSLASSQVAPYVETTEGVMIAERGDFIIKGVKGEFYPCKPDFFWATYEEVDCWR